MTIGTCKVWQNNTYLHRLPSRLALQRRTLIVKRTYQKHAVLVYARSAQSCKTTRSCKTNRPSPAAAKLQEIPAKLKDNNH